MELGINKNIHNIVWFILFTVSGIAFIFIPTLGNYANNIDKNSYEPLIYKGVGAIFIIIALYRAFRNNSKNEIEETTSNNTNTDIDIITNNNEMSYKEFIDKLEIDEFDEIILMAHTGKNSLSLLRKANSKFCGGKPKVTARKLKTSCKSSSLTALTSPPCSIV